MFNGFLRFKAIMKYSVISLFILGIIFCSHQNLLGQAKINESLVDLKELMVTVQIDSKLSKIGLEARSVYLDAILELPAIISRESSNKLLIFVNAIEIKNNYFSYSIEVSLNQLVLLERRKIKSFYAPTWTMITMGATNENKDISEDILKILKKFTSDFLLANPNFFPDLSDLAINKKDNSPFTATYVGGNRPPEVEVFNDSDRTLYLDFGQNTLTPYTIPPKTSKKFTLTEGIYKYKATAPRVVPLEGQKTFERGYVYTWRFVIVTRKIN